MKQKAIQALSVLLSVLLLIAVFTALPVMAEDTGAASDTLTVTATSNFFPETTVTLTQEELAAHGNKVTVSYYYFGVTGLLLDAQWVMRYSTDMLSWNAEDNGDLMPVVSGYAPSSSNAYPTDGRILGNFSYVPGVPLPAAADNDTAFVSVTFRVSGTGTAAVYLDVEVLTDGTKDMQFVDVVNQSEVLIPAAQQQCSAAVFAGPGESTSDELAADIAGCQMTLTETAYTYDGTAKTPAVTVTDGDKTLAENVDYTLSYVDNINAGTATAVATGIGAYCGTLRQTFSIAPNGVTLTATSNYFPSKTVYYSPQTLEDNENLLTVTYLIRSPDRCIGTEWRLYYSPSVLELREADNQTDGAVRLMPFATSNEMYTLHPASGGANATGNYSDPYGSPLQRADGGKIGFVTATFRVIGSGSATVDLQVRELTVLPPDVPSVSGNDIGVLENGNVVNAEWDGAPSTEVYGGGYDAHYGETPQPKDIADCTVTLSQNEFTYDGMPKKPVATVQYGGQTLRNDTDYIIIFNNNTKAGNASVNVIGLRGYTGTVSVPFTILPRPLQEAAVTLSETTYLFDGKEKTPAVTVTCGGRTLKEGRDYTVRYADNRAAGTATVTVTGKGNYTGAAAAAFRIEKPAGNFTWGRDNWSFNNSNAYFEDHSVNAGVLEAMADTFQLTETDKMQLRNGIDKYNAADARNRMFTGSCFGMTVSEILAKQGDLVLSDYGGSDIVYENSYTDSNMTSVINFLQAMQNVGQMGQRLRQAAFLSGENNFSQSAFISKLEEVLAGGDMLVKISYGTKKSSGSVGYHSVVAYGLEGCNYHSDVTGLDYDMRILVADPNFLAYNALLDDACIYYRSGDKSWICPYWSPNPNRITASCYWNASDGSSLPHGFIRNIMHYLSAAETADLMTDYVAKHYIAGMTVETENDAIPFVDKLQAPPGADDDDYDIPDDGITRVHADRDGETEETAEQYSLWNDKANYTVTYYTPADCTVDMDYEDTAFRSEVHNATYMEFDPCGRVDVRGSDVSYVLEMTANQSVSGWNTLRVTGGNTDKVSLANLRSCYELNADALYNITFRLEGAAGVTEGSFSVDGKTVLICFRDDHSPYIKADTNGDGVYETELPVNVTSRAGDLDGDNAVTIGDVTLLQRGLSEMTAPNGDPVLDLADSEVFAQADVNRDGKVNVRDVTYLQRYLAELTDV